MASTWIKEHPKDSTFRLYLAQAALAKGRLRHRGPALPGAAGSRSRTTPMLLNNLAWAAGQIQRSEGDRVRGEGQQARSRSGRHPRHARHASRRERRQGARARIAAEGVEAGTGSASHSAEPRQGADQHGAEGCREEGAGRTREAGRQVQVAGRCSAVDEGALSMPNRDADGSSASAGCTRGI